MHGLTLVFDLDGTLIDTAPDLIRATNHALAAKGLAPVDGAEIRPHVSFGARHMIQRGLEVHRLALPAHEIDAMLERFLTYYADNIAVDSAPYPSLLTTLDRLASAGATLAVCTNKREDLARRLLASLGLTARFAAICGRDTFSVCKPDPGHLTQTISASGGNAARAVMVGDSNVDVATAKAARIPVIGVTFGYTEIPMHDLAADAVIDHYDEFEGALGRVLGRAAIGGTNLA
jgi:phosphoglycolate phosphatase